MERYIKRPVLFFLIFNILGVLSQYFDNVYIGFFIMLTITIFISKYFNCKNIFLIVCVTSFLFGLNSMRISETKINIINNYDGYNTTVKGKVVEIYSNEKAYIEVIESNNNFLENKKIVIVGKVSNYVLGDTLLVKGSINLFERKNNFGGFNEYLYENSKKAICKIEIDTVEIVDKNNSYFYFLVNENVNNNINFENREIIRTMTLGLHKDLSNSLKELYRTAGIYHILAISGLHIGIIYSFLLAIFKKISFLKNKTYLIIFILLYYCYLTGNSISTVRAVFMCSLLIISDYVNRNYDILNTLYVVALCLIMNNPFLLFSISFMYSFGCILGIGLFKESLSLIIFRLLQHNEKLYKIFAKKSFVDSVCIILSVTLVIIPINIYYFNAFNVFSIVLNILIVPFITLLVLSSFLVVMFGTIKIIVVVFSPIITVVFYIFNILLNTFNYLQFGNILVQTPSILSIVLYYIFIYFFISYMVEKNRINRKIILVSFIALLILNIYPRNDSIVFLNDTYKNQLNVVVQSGNRTILISNNSSGNMYLFNNYLDYVGVKEADIYININSNFLLRNEIEDEARFKTLILPSNTVENGDKISYNELYEILEQQNITLKNMKNKDEIILGDINIRLCEYEPQNNYLEISVNNYEFNLANNNSHEIEDNKIFEINYGNRNINFNATINSENEINEVQKYNLLQYGDIKFITDEKLKIKTLR